jgi:hypothetical protein
MALVGVVESWRRLESGSRLAASSSVSPRPLDVKVAVASTQRPSSSIQNETL